MDFVNSRREVVPLCMSDGATADLLVYRADGPVRAALLWLPAMGVAARHYEPLALALAAHGVAVGLHEARGHGSSSLRAARHGDWGYRELLTMDIPASLDGLAARLPGVPLYIGGHSLGGQLACLFAGMASRPLAGITLVASGAPYWRRFPRWVWLAYRAAPLLAGLAGRFPGRRIGFGGNEARGVIGDWARSGRTGRYAAKGVSTDLEAALRGQSAPVSAHWLAGDWLAPRASLDFLLEKMPHAPRTVHRIEASDLGGLPDDHFAWMKSPSAVAARMASGMLGP